MRIANLAGRLVIVTDTGAVDVEEASSGRFGSDPTAVYRVWAEFREWADGVAARRGYRVRYVGIGTEDAERGAPTQMAVFSLGEDD